jgi:hypothetical protein
MAPEPTYQEGGPAPPRRPALFVFHFRSKGCRPLRRPFRGGSSAAIPQAGAAAYGHEMHPFDRDFIGVIGRQIRDIRRCGPDDGRETVCGAAARGDTRRFPT